MTRTNQVSSLPATPHSPHRRLSERTHQILSTSTSSCSSESAELQRFRDDVLHGLTRANKTLPCKYLYDRRGSELFDAITQADDYYPTQAELEIFDRYMPEIANRIGPDCVVVEYGSGSGNKTTALLDHLPNPAAYVPVEISASHLEASAERLRARYPGLKVAPICGDFHDDLRLPDATRAGHRVLVFFPGSTLGNFSRRQAQAFLRRNARLCGPGGEMLIGVDLMKDVDVLRRAYDDSDGVTRDFNRNLLERINRELGANFDVDAFEHEAVVNEEIQRVEMHLVSTRDQAVELDGRTIKFSKGESIVTEHSNKHTVETFAELVESSLWRIDETWTDRRGYFSEHLLVVDELPGDAAE